LSVRHVLIQYGKAGGKELVIGFPVPEHRGRTHPEQGLQDRFGQVKLETGGRRAVRVRQGEQLGPAANARRPELTGPIPPRRLQLVDAILEQVIRAGEVRPVV
jgi:hypothetical protein